MRAVSVMQSFVMIYGVSQHFPGNNDFLAQDAETEGHWPTKERTRCGDKENVHSG